MEILKASDDRRMEIRSSIDQYRHFLSAFKQGGWVPVSYDVIETAGCDGTKKHEAIMTDDKNWNGFHFPIAYCKVVNGKYLLTDKQGIETLPLPEWMGEGEFQSYVDEHRITNADNEAVGTANVITFKIGLDYCLAKETLPVI